MKRVEWIIVIVFVFTSCQTTRQYLVKNGNWKLENEEKFQIIKDTATNEKLYYNVMELEGHLNWEMPIELFSFPLFAGTENGIERKGSLKMDAYTKSVLKKVKFNSDTDTLYLVVRGNIIVYASPFFDMKSATNIILYKHESDWEIQNPPMAGIAEDETVPEKYENDIFRTYFYYPKEKLYLIRDCFRLKGHYLNFVYIFQTRTKKNKHTNPREWIAMWDVTSPQKIFYTVHLFKSANALSVKNKQFFDYWKE